jgi:hypothetical protein
MGRTNAAATIRTFYIRVNRSGRLFLNPLAILSMFTNDTFLVPRSIPL